MSLTNASPEQAARAAKESSRRLATLSTESRNAALDAIHDALSVARHNILEANARDLELARASTANGTLNPSIFKRLDLGRAGKFDDMLEGIRNVRDLPDPGAVVQLERRNVMLKRRTAVGRVDLRTALDDGLVLTRQSCPIGVLLIIFEARPEVIGNIAALAIKSANSAILKGGRESTESFRTIATVISAALAKTDVPNDSIQLVTTRDAVEPLLEMSQYIDLVIPRGSNDLVRYCQTKAHMPVLGHADGLCAIYLHADADVNIAIDVVVDSKCDYPAACNAVETLLVHEAVLDDVFVRVAAALMRKGVTLRCDGPAREALAKHLSSEDAVTAGALVRDAADADFSTEFLDLIVAVRTIRDPATSSTTHAGPGKETEESFAAVDAAIEHINAHGSHHTDAIVTASQAVADRFCNGLDSACKFWNCSTRFADGMRFGFGTEVGISTNKVHARGPVGLEGLTIHEYRIAGSGQGAAMYSGQAGRRFKHKALPL